MLKTWRISLPGGTELGFSALCTILVHCLLSFFQQVMGWQRLAIQISGEKQAQAVCQGFNHIYMRCDFLLLARYTFFCTKILMLMEKHLISLHYFQLDPCPLLWLSSPRFPPAAWPALGRADALVAMTAGVKCTQGLQSTAVELLPMRLPQLSLCHLCLLH